MEFEVQQKLKAQEEIQTYKDRLKISKETFDQELRAEKQKAKLIQAELSMLKIKFQALEENQKEFYDNFSKLLQCKAEHGGCLVPSYYQPTSLAWWVKKVRQIRKSKSSKINYLTMGRIQLLDSVGFRWSSVVEEKEPAVHAWERMYLQLVKFKQEHGHCNPPQNTTGFLGRWVSFQRNRYVSTQKWQKYIQEHGSDYGFSCRS